MSRRRDPPDRLAQHPDPGSAARSAEESLGKLTAEHLALRRVAELVAKGAPPGELFDTVAVYLAFARQFCKMERLGLRVTDEGFTVPDDQAKQMDVATEWNDLEGYRDLLVNRLCGEG